MFSIIRALRLPFITASILPFIFGSLLGKTKFNFFNFILGVISVIGTHLGSNLINDYADSKSGVDWQDKQYYNFFGGSKLIQENILSGQFYLKAAVFCFILASLAVLVLAIILKDSLIIWLYSIILFLGYFYSHKPLQFSYRRMGEIIIFFLFGPALVMGGYFIQTGNFPALDIFLLSFPFGLFTTAILFANEIPDYPQDKKAGKFTWVDFTGQKGGFELYNLLMFFGFFSILICIILGYLGKVSLFSFILILPAIKAGSILRRYYSDKNRLLESSKITVIMQSVVSIILILDKIL